MARFNASATQEHLPIAGIVDSTVIMTDGSLRAVVRLDPINFELKSETEQNAIVYAYQNFLNSLEFPIQIVIQSKKLDLEQYLIRLEKSQNSVTNELLRIQIEDYVGFVRRLISVANIMSKRFFVVVSYSPVSKSAGVAQISNLFHRQPTGPIMDEQEFARYRAEIFNRANIIAGGLSRMSIKGELLDTQALIELFYGIYNPDVVAEERLTDITNLSTSIVGGIEVPETEPRVPETAPAPAPTLEQVAAPVPDPLLRQPPAPVSSPPPSAPVTETAPAPAPAPTPPTLNTTVELPAELALDPDKEEPAVPPPPPPVSSTPL